MAVHIDRKLRLTAALLGTVTRKDLAAAFRRINPATVFDVDRADKWLQGRAKPRQLSVYEDWLKILDVQQTADWVADSNLETFIEEICARHNKDRSQLERRAATIGKATQPGKDERGTTLAGLYVCYSHSWSPYYQGLLIRGTMLIEAQNGPQRLVATYSENVPTIHLRLKGQVISTKRSVHIHVGEPGGDTQFFFSLFAFSPPGSVLGGFMGGATVLGPASQPSVTRIVMVRLKDPDQLLMEADGYLEPGTAISADLERFGVSLDQPGAADKHLMQFLNQNTNSGSDQIQADDFQRLVSIFDRQWLGR